jgi:hypothetical protein
MHWKDWKQPEMCQYDTENSIIVMCNKVENELYRMGAQEERNKTLLLIG